MLYDGEMCSECAAKEQADADRKMEIQRQRLTKQSMRVNIKNRYWEAKYHWREHWRKYYIVYGGIVWLVSVFAIPNAILYIEEHSVQPDTPKKLYVEKIIRMPCNCIQDPSVTKV
jgi:hypothetical protein